MNLLVLDQFSDLGGAQQALAELLPAIRDCGWRALVGLPGTGELFDRVRDLGFDAGTITCGPYSSGQKSLTDMARFLGGTPRLASEIRTLAARTNADLVYINGPRIVPAVALAGLRAPVVFHAHSFIGPGPLRMAIGSALRKINARVVGSCEFVAESWRPYVSRDRLTVIYNGVDGPPGLPRSSSVPTIGCIGRIAPEKGQLEFLQAAALIHKSIPHCRFRIHGAALFDDPGVLRYEAQVRAAASGLPVEFPGWAPNVYSALAGLDLLLVPSAAHEATTRVILEAFAAGVPVIAFRSGGIPEVIDAGLDGYLAGDADEMARVAVDLLSGPPDRRSSIAEAAHQTWSRRFTKERYHHQLLETLERSLGTGEPLPRPAPPQQSGPDPIRTS
jgi:glycosyltransferase involved in cell wall biosynthesis